MADENFDYLDKMRTAELVSEIKRRLGSKADQVFVGTDEDWENLTPEQQSNYQIIYVTNDISNVGSEGGERINIFSQECEPVALDEEFSEGDFLAINTGDGVYSSLYTYNDGEWVECEILGYGNFPGAPSSAALGKYFIATTSGVAQVILQCNETSEGSGQYTWAMVAAKSPNPSQAKLFEASSIPVPKINEGDLWTQTDVDGAIEALYRYEPDPEDETAYIWNKLCKISLPASIVGENVGQHNERFNDYENNTISGGDYNHVEGNSNTVAGYNIHAEGRSNKIPNTSSYACSIGGVDNMIVPSSYYSFFYGQNNKAINGGGSITSSWLMGDNVTITCQRVIYSAILGYRHTISGTLEGSIVAGEQNTVSSSLTGSAVFGQENTVKGSTVGGSILAGQQNTTNSNLTASFVIGQLNDLSTTEQSVVCGWGNSGVSNNALVCGRYGTADTDSRIVVGNGESSAKANSFLVKYDGNVYASGSYNAMGADYAEYFEWLDGNPENEDRRGMLVSLDGDKILPANGDDVFGVISVAPSVVGNSESLGWRGKYKRDVFGAIIYDEEGRPILSDDYDNDEKYIPRSERPEWAAVGLMGKLIVTDDGSCLPNRYCTAENGIAKLSGKETRVRMLRRIDEAHIEVLVR